VKEIHQPFLFISKEWHMTSNGVFPHDRVAAHGQSQAFKFKFRVRHSKVRPSSSSSGKGEKTNPA
jgi:hypothetical protein